MPPASGGSTGTLACGRSPRNWAWAQARVRVLRRSRGPALPTVLCFHRHSRFVRSNSNASWRQGVAQARLPVVVGCGAGLGHRQECLCYPRDAGRAFAKLRGGGISRVGTLCLTQAPGGRPFLTTLIGYHNWVGVSSKKCRRQNVREKGQAEAAVPWLLGTQRRERVGARGTNGGDERRDRCHGTEQQRDDREGDPIVG